MFLPEQEAAALDLLAKDMGFANRLPHFYRVTHRSQTRSHKGWSHKHKVFHNSTSHRGRCQRQYATNRLHSLWSTMKGIVTFSSLESNLVFVKSLKINCIIHLDARAALPKANGSRTETRLLGGRRLQNSQSRTAETETASPLRLRKCYVGRWRDFSPLQGGSYGISPQAGGTLEQNLSKSIY